MARKVSIEQHHRRWAILTAVVLFVVAGAVAVIAFVQDDMIAKEPWGYIALIVAAFAALAGFILAFAMAAIESSHD